MSFIQDGHKFDLGDLTLRAYHTPGHTTDSIILHLEARMISISFKIFILII